MSEINLNESNETYAKKRNNVYPTGKRGSSYLSPYIRHGLLTLKDVWHAVEKFPYEDKTKFRDELLWQEYSRHVQDLQIDLDGNGSWATKLVSYTDLLNHKLKTELKLFVKSAHFNINVQ